MPSNAASLQVVATPLGNPGDLSPRAREALAGADLVLAEDTRRAGLLFQRLGVEAKRFLSFFDHNEEARLDQVIPLLEQGNTVALISDAGTPLVSDPGYRLVRACRERGIPVVPIPGPSAVLAALMGSGLPPHPFAFLGFPPRKSSELGKLLAPYSELKTTLVLFERKDRVAKTLALAAEILGPREFCLARELTKTHEEFIVGRLDRLQDLPGNLLGEVTLVIGPPGETARTPREQVLAVADREQARGGKPRQVAARVRSLVSGWSAGEIYDLLSRRQ